MADFEKFLQDLSKCFLFETPKPNLSIQGDARVTLNVNNWCAYKNHVVIVSCYSCHTLYNSQCLALGTKPRNFPVSICMVLKFLLEKFCHQDWYKNVFDNFPCYLCGTSGSGGSQKDFKTQRKMQFWKQAPREVSGPCPFYTEEITLSAMLENMHATPNNLCV